MPQYDTQAPDVPPITTYSPADLDRIERRAFSRPFVLVDAENRGVGTESTRAAARRALSRRSDVATIAGTLVPGVWAVDVDEHAAPGHLEHPEHSDLDRGDRAGAVAGEELAAWCEDRGLPWLLLGSGRPGHRHLVVVLSALLVGELNVLCRRLAARHGLQECRARQTLRLPTAPHRQGHPTAVLGGTLRAADLPSRTRASTVAAAAGESGAKPKGRSVPVGRAARRQRMRTAPGVDDTRSAQEFGEAVARVRAGWSARRAWTAADVEASKAAERGRDWWQAFLWLPAVTTVAAERGCTEAQAWQRAVAAAPGEARRLGLSGWRVAYWQRAVEEAGQDRPRRYDTARGPGAAAALTPVEQLTDQQRETALVAAGLVAAGAEVAQRAGVRPQRARSIGAAAHALADALVNAEGWISTRTWALRARLDRNTVYAARDLLASHDVIHRVATYSGGAKDSDRWVLGPAAQRHIAATRETSATRWYTPTPHGQANPQRLHTTIRRERRMWRLRCALVAEADRRGVRLAQLDTPAARTLRSVWHQRRWWTNLTPAEQEERRTRRRAELGRLHRAELTLWLTWLEQRADIVGSTELTVLDQAPVTVHLGLRCPPWRATTEHGGAAHDRGEQLALTA